MIYKSHLETSNILPSLPKGAITDQFPQANR